MKKFSKCFSALFLSCFLAFGNISGCYLEVQAFEWVSPSLSVGDSILWLLGLLGITYTEGASAWRDVSPEYEQDFIDYANEHGLTYTQTDTWLNDVASGKLNQLSEVWSSFKEWVKSKFSSSSANYYTLGSIIDSVVPNASANYSGDISLNSSIPVLCASYSNGNNKRIFIMLDSYSNFTTYSNTRSQIQVQGYPMYDIYITSSATNIYYYDSSSSRGIYTFIDSSGPSWYGYNTLSVLQGLGLGNNVLIPSIREWDITSSSAPDTDFSIYNPSLVPDINFVDANTEEASIPGVIDLPWGNLGDDEAERDETYDDLVGGLDLGQEIGDLWQALQDLIGVLAVDDTGVLQPNDGGENPPTLEDEVENNKVNGAFVLSGLEKVFPFCIPFDLYAFMTLLVAEPVAPVINWPIYNPITDSNEIITIDFSTWESVVILLRYIFDFLFIVGLLLMARALIGGGDSA